MEMDFITKEALARMSQAEQQVGRVCQCLTAVQPTRSSHWWHPGFQSVLLTQLLFPRLSIEAVGILARLRTWRETVRATAAGQSGLPFQGDRERILTDGEAWFVQARQDLYKADILEHLDAVETRLVQCEFLHVPLPGAPNEDAPPASSPSVNLQGEESSIQGHAALIVDAGHLAGSTGTQTTSSSLATSPGELLDLGAKAFGIWNAIGSEAEQLLALNGDSAPLNYEI